MALSGNLWPLHLKPKEDELLSSWMVRLARAMNLNLHTFCDLAWRNKPIWNRDIDKSASSDILELLADKTATPIERARQTTLEAYEGWLYEHHNPNGNTRWIMPMGIYHRTRRLFGQQFCSLCLAGDDDPYFRRKWRLAFVTLCEVHRRQLLDRCPHCGRALNFHRIPLDQGLISVCAWCGADLCAAERFQRPARDRDLANQARLQDVLAQGWAPVPGYGPVYSLLYFAVLHQMLKILATGKGSAALRSAVSVAMDESPFEPRFPRNRREVERLDVGDRLRLVRLASWLLSEWPDRFVQICFDIDTRSSILMRDLEPAPYFYADVVHQSLYEPTRGITSEEIRAASAYLRVAGHAVTGNSLGRLLGIRQVPRRRMGPP